MYHTPVPKALSKTQEKLQLSLFQPAPSVPSETADPVLLKFRRVLIGIIPDPALSLVLNWFSVHKVSLLITRGRSSKSGDFRPPRNGSPPRISINRTLNEYAFLITLLHEMAHYYLFEEQSRRSPLKRRKRVPPHGERWKEEFRQLITPYLIPEIFPAAILEALQLHLKNPRASTHSDPHLARVLLHFDPAPEGILMEKLPEGGLFTTTSGMLFRKEEKLRKRYRCQRLKDRKMYLFSPLARVFPVDT